MSDPSASNIDPSPSGTQPELLAGERRRRCFEVFLVLLVAIGGPFLGSLYLLNNSPSAAQNVSSPRWVIGVLQESTALLLLGYVLSRRGLRLKDIGLRWSLRDVGVGLLVAVVSYLGYVAGSMAVHSIHYAMYGSLATGPTPRELFPKTSVVAVPFFLLTPFFEELIVRAYLMTEILDLTGSSMLAVVLSVAVQFSYHLYYGWTGALSLSFPFLLFALYYARSRRALPIIVAHGCFDVYGLISLW